MALKLSKSKEYTNCTVFLDFNFLRTACFLAKSPKYNYYTYSTALFFQSPANTIVTLFLSPNFLKYNNCTMLKPGFAGISRRFFCTRIVFWIFLYNWCIYSKKVEKRTIQLLWRRYTIKCQKLYTVVVTTIVNRRFFLSVDFCFMQILRSPRM